MYSSSDQSTVFINPGERVATQIFRHESEYQKVKRVALEIATSPSIHTLCSDGEIYSYTLVSYHSHLEGYDDRTRTVKWSRILCLNQLDPSIVITCIRKNWIKFFWDIFRGIFGMHVCGFHHGDVSLDNIGIRDGTFVLYDYNLSRANRYASEDLQRDIYTLFRSLRWRISRDILTHREMCLLDTLRYIQSLEEFIMYVKDEQNFQTLSETLLFLDALTIHPTYTQANETNPTYHNPDP